MQRYISFFDTLNNRKQIDDDFYKYERCALLIVNFETGKVYSNTEELKDEGLVGKDFGLDLRTLSFENFIKDLLEEYERRFGD